MFRLQDDGFELRKVGSGATAMAGQEHNPQPVRPVVLGFTEDTSGRRCANFLQWLSLNMSWTISSSVMESGNIPCIGRDLFPTTGPTAHQLESAHPDRARLSEMREIRGVFEWAVRRNVVWEEEPDVGRREV
jgi:hypothetical protein